ncbi:TPA: hypothetical protein DCX16_02220 [bacterium]|nr:hypothetical protein [bacterium]
MDKSILEIEHLTKHFFIQGGFFSKKRDIVKALDDISFKVKKGKVFGIVGESGSGKSTLAKVIIGLIPKTSGRAIFDGCDISDGISKAQRKDITIVFQNPDSSLSPRKKAYDILKEPLDIHKIENKKQRVEEITSIVGIKWGELKKYPHQFSGGEKQRIGIARALVTNPKLVILDEPVSSLDVTTSAVIINLLSSLIEKLSLSLLFISHDLRVVEYIADDVAVVYLGKIVEVASKNKLFSKPIHPYTKELLNSVPPSHPRERRFIKTLISDEHLQQGCLFYPRCPIKKEFCKKEPIEPKAISSDHFVACRAMGDFV